MNTRIAAMKAREEKLESIVREQEDKIQTQLRAFQQEREEWLRADKGVTP